MYLYLFWLLMRLMKKLRVLLIYERTTHYTQNFERKIQLIASGEGYRQIVAFSYLTPPVGHLTFYPGLV